MNPIKRLFPDMRLGGLSPGERNAVVILSAILALRFFGLFLLLPVLSIYAYGLKGGSLFLAGLAVGAYGLSQAALQFPLGMLSDRLGRKLAIGLGLLLYAWGCAWAGSSAAIGGLIVGRLIQGCGSVSSAVLSMLYDATSREEARARATAWAGTALGLSFTAGFLLGPLIAAKWGVPSLFWLMAALDLAALTYLSLFIEAPVLHHKNDFSLSHLKAVLRDRNMAAANLLTFLLHLGVTAVFVAAPFFLEGLFMRSGLWKAYVPMILIGCAVLFPALSYAERHRKTQELIFGGIFLSGAGCFLLSSAGNHPSLLALGLVAYFVGFVLIEPNLPVLLTRFAPLHLRGTAIGTFNMGQALGTLFGGVLGGFLLAFHVTWLYPFLLLLCIPWFWAASRLDNPKNIHSVRFQTKPGTPHHAAELRRLHGIYDAHWLAHDHIELRYSGRFWNEEHLRAVLRHRGLL